MVGIYNSNPSIDLKSAMLEAEKAIRSNFKNHKSFNQMIVALDASKSAFNKYLISEAPQNTGSRNLVEKALQEEEAKPIKDLKKIEELKSVLNKKETTRATNSEIREFKKMYNEFLRLTNPSDAAKFPPDVDWGTKRFNNIWNSMGGLRGIIRTLSNEKMRRGKTVEV